MVFEMTEDEKSKVNQVVEFILLFYAKLWFTTPLAGSAARQDLDFMTGILKYRAINPSLYFAVVSSTYRHFWYLRADHIFKSCLFFSSKLLIPLYYIRTDTDKNFRSIGGGLGVHQALRNIRPKYKGNGNNI